ncbi:TonB-dependent receptor [Caulobacter segnis]|uniref:TonB-dependent receptor n=2 Tax=Caulobacter segnis TaxID=88688 RepID=D5VIH2_CAUST|nr:TonB-dependent receptor [Caulobacter segnis]ADG09546.1 TonB-dependent receptor [Caulobacter segnis ATCC 21756]AVQ01330.1 TonB-dependent receptor [Caulobacter segnis]
MPSRLLMLSASLLALSVFAPAGARAETQVSDQVDAVVIVARDKAGLLEKAPSQTVFGIDKPLIETPRSASLVSDLTLERYGVQSLDGATKVAPGTHTASFYGVPGSLNIRGALAENYFRGFKRVENRGTYSTPIGGAARIEILRGPPTPVYGAGKVGGLVNFIPKSARDEGRFLAEPEGEVTATFGSYNKKLVTGQFGAPVTLGAAEGGVYVYGEAEDSHSYYKGIYPRHRTLEASADFDLGNGWSTAFGGMAFHSEGDVQTPGWNRLTQDLIDHRTYVTGRDTTLRDADGNGKITPNEIGAYPYASALYLPYYGYPTSDAVHTLDAGVGTTKLDRRTVYISPADFSKTNTQTLYFDLAKDLGGDRSLTLQLFHDRQDNKRFVSYGYPSAIDAKVSEVRLTYAFPTELGPVRARTLTGVSHRWFEGRRRESYNSGLIALDRRDISFGVTATDTIDSPFDDEPGGIGVRWENDNRSTWKETGAFFTSDIVAGRWNLVLGGRWDHYSVESEDTGFLSYTVAGRQADDRDKATWSASLTYKLPVGLMPYASYAKASALEMSQAGDIAPGLIADGSWLSSSDLSEAGVKFQLLRGTLIGSLAAYRQTRTQIAGAISPPTVQGLRSKGVELELRWLASERLSFTFAGNNQRTTVRGPDTSFQYIPAYTAGVPGAQAYGGSYVVWSFASLPGRGGDYAYTLTPKSVLSLYGTYTSKGYDWGQAGATVGVSYVGRTAGTVQNAVHYPSYELVNASAFVARGPYTLSINIDNLLDTFYVTPDADTYANLGALPGKGREWRATLKRTF